MPGSLTIRQARLVLPDRVVVGDILIDDGVIAEIGPRVTRTAGEEIDGTSLTVLPGVIDPHVHFRDPGDNPTEDFASGSRAAAAGGVTAVLDMPEDAPACTTLDALHARLDRASATSVVHYGCFIEATADNIEVCNAAERACGIAVRHLHDPSAIEEIFHRARTLIAFRAEDEVRLQQRRQLYENTHEVAEHPKIHDVEGALLATRQAAELSGKHGRRLHLMQLSSAEEVGFLRTISRDLITSEVSPQHLFLHAEDAYAQLGTLAQCDPPIRNQRHAQGLWKGLVDGVVDTIASNHAPQPLSAKRGHYPDTPSGMPGVEWALPLLLHEVNQRRATLNQVARWMSEAPARCYGIPRKGRLETGFDGDIVLVDMAETRVISDDTVRSGCRWSPFSGLETTGWPVMTVLSGLPVYRDGQIVGGVRGRELTYSR